MWIKAQILFLMISSILFGTGIEDVTTYHTNSNLQWTEAMNVIKAMEWNGNEKVLDVGCGDGKITAYIAESCSKSAVIGADISASMIQFASQKYNLEQHKNLVFLVADAANLPFEKQFDVVVSFSTLHWVVNQEEGLRAIYRSLVPGGRVGIVTYGQAPMNIIGLSESLIATEKWIPHFPNYFPQRVYFNEEDYIKLMDKVGFTQVVLNPIHSQKVYDDRKSLAGMVSPLLTFTEHLSPNIREEFLEDLLDQIVLLSKKTPDGSIVYEMLIFQVFAVR